MISSKLCFLDVKPAYFLLFVWIDLCAQHFGDELRTKTNTNYYFSTLNSSADKLFFFFQPWVYSFVVNAHWSAHYNKPIKFIKRRELRFVVQLCVINYVSLCHDPLVDATKAFERNVL